MGASLINDFKKQTILVDWAVEVRYGPDYLRFNFLRQLPYLDRVLSRLDFDNSNFAYDEENDLSYTKLKLSTGPCLMISCYYDNKSIPIGLYNVFENGIKKQVRSRLDFYGSYFRLEELGFFELGWYKSFIEDLTSEVPSITRVDYCVDLFYQDDRDLLKPKKLFPHSLSSDVLYKMHSIKSWKSLESWAIWSKSSKRNVIRMYDKIADIQAKWKFFLYQDYLNWKSVHRLEIQFGPNFCKYYYLDNMDEMFWKITNIFQINKNTINGPLFYSYSNKHEINDYTRLYYTKQFTGRAEKFFYSKVNPYLVLLNYFDTNIKKLEDQRQHKIYLMELWLKLKNHDLLIDVLSWKESILNLR